MSLAPTSLVALAAAQGSLEDATIALAASEDPEVDEPSIREGLDQLAAPIRIPRGASTIEAIARLQLHLGRMAGLQGDDVEYDAPHNSLIHRVLERRRGLPILLSAVWIAVGERVGVALDPIAFPGHFLIAPRKADPRFFVDPFVGGDVIREERLQGRLASQERVAVLPKSTFDRVVTPPSTSLVMRRMCANLAISYQRRDDLAGISRMLVHLRALPEPPKGDPLTRALEDYLAKRR